VAGTCPAPCELVCSFPDTKEVGDILRGSAGFSVAQSSCNDRARLHQSCEKTQELGNNPKKCEVFKFLELVLGWGIFIFHNDIKGLCNHERVGTISAVNQVPPRGDMMDMKRKRR